MSSKDEYEKLKEEKENKKLKEENENENENEDEDYDYEIEDEDEQQIKTKKNKIIKDLNDNLDEIIDKSKSFEDQIKLFKKLEALKGHWPYNDYDDKELKSKYLKIELANMSNEIDKKLFEQIFGHTYRIQP